jgi:tetratricopeptide (TPR) repeat protein
MDRGVRVWETGAGRVVTPLIRLRAVPSALAFSGDGRWLASGDEAAARIWDARTGRPRTGWMPHRERVDGIAWSTDGTLLATITEHEARVWEAETGEPVTPSLRQDGRLAAVWFERGGRLLAARRDTGERVRWRIGPREEPAERLRVLAAVLSCGTIDASGERSLVESPDWLAAWNTVGPMQPATAGPARLLAFHQRRAAELETAGDWTGALRHLEPLCRALPWREAIPLRRAQALAETGQWERAAAGFAGLLAARRGTIEYRLVWYWSALAHLRAGDTAGYQRACAGMLQQFASGDRRERDLTAWTCAFGELDAERREEALRIAERLVSEKPEDASALDTLGALLYRVGRYQEARSALQRSFDRSSGLSGLSGEGPPPVNALFFSLVCRRLGRTDDAREWLERARRAIAARSRSTSETPHLRQPWDDRAEREILLREAEARP